MHKNLLFPWNQERTNVVQLVYFLLAVSFYSSILTITHPFLNTFIFCSTSWTQRPVGRTCPLLAAPHCPPVYRYCLGRYSISNWWLLDWCSVLTKSKLFNLFRLQGLANQIMQAFISEKEKENHRSWKFTACYHGGRKSKQQFFQPAFPFVCHELSILTGITWK